MEKAVKTPRRSWSRKLARLRLAAARREMVETLMSKPIAYMPDDRFRRSAVMAQVMEDEIKVTPGVSLTGAQEGTLFLQLNYARHRFCQVRRKLLRQVSWRKDLVEQLIRWNELQLALRSKAVGANMGLVLAMAKRVDYGGVEFTELISEGSMALLRATEKFDCSRGIKFSTYACRAILKGFSRAAKQTYRNRNMFPVQWEPIMEKDDWEGTKRREAQQDWVEEVQTIIGRNLAELSDVELSVVGLRFSLDDADRKPMTLKEVGARLGLTKERIRQIQNNALVKLRAVTEERMTPSAANTVSGKEERGNMGGYRTEALRRA